MISTNNAFSYFTTNLPQQQHLIHSQSTEKTDFIPNISQRVDGKRFLSPPCYHSSGASFAVTCVEQMTVDQTANWINTFGRYHGWEQAEFYAENFKNQSITGAVLKELTPEMLEFSLGMRNQRCQQELLLAIQRLYPNMRIQRGHDFTYFTGLQVPESSCGSANKSGRGSVGSYYDSNNSYLVSLHPKITDKYQQTNSDLMSMSGYSQRSVGVSYTASESYFGSEEFSGSMGSSVRRSQDTTEVGISNGKTREEYLEEVEEALLRGSKTLRCRKLLLILQNDQIVSDNIAIQSIRARFQELKIQVQVEPMQDKRNVYTLVFPNYECADEVLLRAGEIGYKLQKKWPPRPTPKRPLKYKSLAVLKIRTGKSLNADVVGILNKGEIVTVNQVKGRRARLIEEKENGEFVTIGWVSIHEEDGFSLLRQLGDF
jgi:hypothetical protein